MRTLAVAFSVACAVHPLSAAAQSIDAMRVAVAPLAERASPPRLRLPPMRPECTPWVVTGGVTGAVVGLAVGIVTVSRVNRDGGLASLYAIPFVPMITTGGGFVVGVATGYLACNVRYIGHDPDPAAASSPVDAPWSTPHFTSPSPPPRR